MCLIAFAWKVHPEYSLLVGANRDEWHDRPTAPAAWWDDYPQILAGRDLRAGGTWLGVSRSGRFAALTNFRDPSNRKSDAPSRGMLVRDFLLGTALGMAPGIAVNSEGSVFTEFVAEITEMAPRLAPALTSSRASASR